MPRYGRLARLEKQVMDLTSLVNQFVTEDTELQGDLAGISEHISAQDTQIATLTSQVTSLEAGSVLTQDQVSALQNSAASIGTTHTALAALIPTTTTAPPAAVPATTATTTTTDPSATPTT